MQNSKLNSMAKAFQKFIEKKESGAKKKERIRQEKKKIRQETKEYFAKKKEEARLMRQQGGVGPRYGTTHRNEDNTSRKGGYAAGERATRLEIKKDPSKTANSQPKAIAPAKKSPIVPENKKTVHPDNAGSKKVLTVSKAKTGSSAALTSSEQTPPVVTAKSLGQMPLNKFLAHAGVCSRRDAADIVKSGKVLVNGARIVEPGFKVSEKDDIKYMGKTLTAKKNLVYLLINKPKDYITTTEDPQGRKTVLDIVKNATTERVYPIGRLDRNTTGVLLLTNDGELAQKLSHPSYEVKKIYEVTLDKQLTKAHFDQIMNGITLEDGFVAPDVLAWPDPKNKHILGIEIHSGRNRIVRRIFESLGYDVKNLDRVMYANLTKKNVDRGKWRFLSEKEVRLLKYLNSSYKKKNP